MNHLFRIIIGGLEVDWTLREHMYRAHALPISCPRCHETFETDRLKDDHVGAAQRCEMQEKPTLEGLDSTQRDLLKSRKKAHKHMTEVDKWNEMYLIVFPQSDPVNIPTPCKSALPSETQPVTRASN